MEIRYENPAGLTAPSAPFAQIARVRAHEFLYIAGQLSTDADGKVIGNGDVIAQCEQVYTNIEIALRSQGASWKNVAAFTTYVVGVESLPAIGAYRARRFPELFGEGGYPPNTLLLVERLARPSAGSRCGRSRRSIREHFLRHWRT